MAKVFIITIILVMRVKPHHITVAGVNNYDQHCVISIIDTLSLSLYETAAVSLRAE